MRSILLLLLLSVISGCTGVGFVATSDPFEKLAQANSLMAQNRFALAKDVTTQALEIFKNEKNELGMADAYFTYGNLYKQSPDKEYNKSITNYKKAIELFERNGEATGVSKSLVGIGNVYGIKGDNLNECKHYSEALNYYQLAKKKSEVNHEPLIYDERYKNLGELIEAYIKGYCK